MTATIMFLAKPETIYNMDNTVAYRRLKMPKLSRSHCDMNAFRRHPKFGGYVNSDLFIAMLKRAVPVDGYIRLDRPLPAGVTVDASGFLHKVTIAV